LCIPVIFWIVVETLETVVALAVERGVQRGTRHLMAAALRTVPESTASDRDCNQRIFKEALRIRYGCNDPNNPDTTKCMILGFFFSTDQVVAAHLVSLKERHITPLLGFKNVWDNRNGILVHKALEAHYGSLELVYVPNPHTHEIQLRVLYDYLMDTELKPQLKRSVIGVKGKKGKKAMTYRDVHLRCLLLPNLVFPFRRALLRHARDAYELMEGNRKSHDVGTGTAPSEEEWCVMFEKCSKESDCESCDWYENMSTASVDSGSD